jgi:hypothetical protein
VKIVLLSSVYITSCCALLPVTVNTSSQRHSSISIVHQKAAEDGLFENDEVLNIKLTGYISELLNDRADVSKYHPLTVSYKAKDSSKISIPAEAKTRGHFRKKRMNCAYPPLLLHFLKSEPIKSSVFKHQNKLKLVMPCKGDEYVIREWLVYKLYNLVTDKSFRARLVRVELDDTQKKKKTAPFYGILLEDEEQMTKRNNSVVINKKMMRMDQTESVSFLKMAVFEYLVGNTDWSVQYLQNITLLAKDANDVPTAVPYDFDLAGLVNAPYALPAEELKMTSVRERRYRGYCITDIKKFEEIVVFYNRLKNKIYSLYTQCPLPDAKYVKASLQYFDEFYKTINDGKALQKEFSYPCDKSGTGDVIIKGLKKN